MKLSIIIPVFNEALTIEKILKKILEVSFPVSFELIIIDDGSTDGTSEKLKEICKDPSFEKITHFESYSINRGKGYAIRKGLEIASGEILAIQDADLEYNPEELVHLISPIIEGKAQVVYGSRFKGKIEKISFSHFIGNKILTLLTNFLFGGNLTDMETCYKVFTREVFKTLALKENRFEIEAEITAQILKNGFKILELPISYSARQKKAGKKINWKDGLSTALKLIKYRFEKNYENRNYN